MVVEKERYLFADQGYGSLIKPAIERYGSVFGHSASGSLSEVVFKLFWRRPDAFHVSGKASQGTLTGG